MYEIVIEIPVNSNLKYEYCHETGHLRLDRVLHTSMTYPGNYGYFPNTLSGDGDPLDAILLMNSPLQPGTYVNVRIIGALITKDENGMDEKILVVPTNDIDPHFKHILNYTDLEDIYLEKIEHFFKNYKNLESNKWCTTNGYVDNTNAIQIYNDSIINYNESIKT